MTFEEWMKRPVYVAQCYTWALAAKLQLNCVRFRALPGYRDDEARQARRLVAEAVRYQRACRRGCLPALKHGQVVFFWAFTGPAGVLGGTIGAAYVDDAVKQVLLSSKEDHLPLKQRRLFAHEHGIPYEDAMHAPGNMQPLFELAGDWGRFSTVVAPCA